MFQSLSMFLAPHASVAQATMTSPPALALPGPRQADKRKRALKSMARIAGNAIGFGMLLAGCWFSLQLMQVLLAQFVA